MKYKTYTVVIIPFLLFTLGFPARGQDQAQMDPVVIQYGDKTLSRRQFDEEFEMAMIMKALETGVPIKNRDQIFVMEHRYLEQRAKEMVLLDVAAERGITVSGEEMKAVLDEYMQSLGFDAYTDKNMQRLGFGDEGRLRDNLRKKKTISLLISDLKKDPEVNDKAKSIDAVIDELYRQSGVRLFPENIRPPGAN